MFLCGAALKLREKHKNHSEPVAKNPEAKPSNDKMVGVNIEGPATSTTAGKPTFVTFRLCTSALTGARNSHHSGLCDRDVHRCLAAITAGFDVKGHFLIVGQAGQS